MERVAEIGNVVMRVGYEVSLGSHVVLLCKQRECGS